MRKKSFSIAFLLSVCFLTGCDEHAIDARWMKEEPTIDKKDISIELIVPTKSVEFWETVNDGAMDSAENYGINLIFEAPESETDSQVSLIEDAISNKVDAIVIAPSVSGKELNDAIDKAINSGIKVINIYSELNNSGVSCTISTNNVYAGSVGADNLASLIGKQGDVAIVSVPDSNNKSRIDRKSGFKDRLSQEYPDIVLTEEYTCTNDVQDAKDTTLRVLKSNPSVKGIYTTNQSVTEGACEAIKQAEKDGLIEAGSVKIVGWNTSLAEIKYIEEGILSGTITQNPYLYGFIGIKYAYSAINKNENENNVVYYGSSDSLQDLDIGTMFIDSSNVGLDYTQPILRPTEF